MNTLDVILILSGASATTLAISLLGSAKRCLNFFGLVKMMIIFSLIPAAGLLLGYWIGSGVKNLMGGINYWIIIIVLILMGVRLLLRSFKIKPEDRMFDFGLFRVLFGVAVAISMDALIFGVGFAFTKIDIWFIIIVFSLFSLIFTIVGYIVGKKNGNYSFGSKIEFLGSLLLLGVGIKLMVQIISLS